MNSKATLFGLAMTGAVALVVSCSGSTDSNDGGSSNGGSGTAGKGGASAAGAKSGTSGSSSGGTGNGTSGSGNSNGGTRPTGGNFNGGFTFGGNVTFGGAGPDISDFTCDPVPQSGSACMPGTQPCLDGNNVCYCAMSMWMCMDVGGGQGGAGPDFGQIDCPATKPTPGTACGDVNGACPFGQSGCACYNKKWVCL